MRLDCTSSVFLLLTIVLSCLLCHSTIAEDSTQAINWTVENIQDDIEISQGNPSIEADDDGGVHVCYFDKNATALMYAYRSTDGDWITEVVDDSSPVGKENSLAVDLDGTVNIAYRDDEHQDLKYARKDPDGAWTLDVIDNDGLTGYHPSICIDSSDTLHVIFYSQSEQGLKYGYKHVGRSWLLSTVYSTSNFQCIGTDMTIDNDNTLHLAYVLVLTGHIGDLFYARKPTSHPWEFNVTPIDNAVKGHISLAVDMKSNLQIVYTLHHGGAVQANKFRDQDWYTDEMGLMENLFEDVSNGITSRGQRYICGRQYPPEGLGCYYETEIGSVRIGLVDPHLSGELYTDLIIDRNDKVHIVYADIGNHRLMYATDRFRPSPPGNVTVVVGDTFVRLHWDPPEGWESIPNLTFNIYRRGPLTYMVPPLLKSGINEFVFIDTEVMRRYTYSYWLSSVSDAGEGHLSIRYEAIPTRYPTMPTDVRLVPGDRHVIMSWKPPTDNQSHVITGYRIYWHNEYIFWMPPNAGPFQFPWKNVTQHGDTLSFNHTGLLNGNTYYYEISAVYEGGEGERSYVQYTMPLRPPSEPINITHQVEDLNITIIWNRPIDDGGFSILKYQVYRGTAIDDLKLSHVFEGFRSDWSVYYEPQTYYRNIRLSETEEFMNLTNSYDFFLYYQVRAVNGAGEGSLSDIIQVPLPILPERPFDVLATGNTTGILLEWSEPRTHSGLPITGYIIHRRALDGDWTTIDTIPGDSLSFFDSDVNMSVVYHYRISAMNDAGEGEPSNPISAEITSPDEEVPFYANWYISVVGIALVLSLVVISIWYLGYKRDQIDQESY